MRHVGAARVHMALRATSHPRGTRALFALFFIHFNIFKSKLNQKKNQKNP